MKKQYFLMAAFATAMAFTACTNDDDLPAINNGEDILGLNEDYIEIAISNTGTGTTRAVRPVGSSEAGNLVKTVKLHFYASTDGTSFSTQEASGISLQVVSGSYSVSNMELTYNGAESTLGTPGDANRAEKVAKLKVSGLSKDVKAYRIVAEGYDTDGFGYTTATADANTAGLFKTENNGADKLGMSTKEIFAGYAEPKITVSVTGTEQQQTEIVKFASSVRIELTRQVAGMLAYFKEVPAYVENSTIGQEIEGYQGKWAKVTKIEVKANRKSTGFQFPNFLMTANKEYNGLYNTESGESDYEAGETLLTFNLTSGISGDPKPGDTYEFTDGYKGAEGWTAPDNFKAQANTLFGGRFILPYAGHVEGQSNTLQVVFYNNQTINATRNVTTDKFTSPQTATNYDILCNNFYSIGKKMEVDDATPEGEGGSDNPISLSATDELTVLINDAWKVIHNMGIE